MRVGRIAVIAVAAYLLFRWAEPSGRGIWVLVGVGGVVLVWVGLRARRSYRVRAEEARQERWARALMSPAERGSVIEELRSERSALDPRKPKAAPKHVELSLMLAELFLADDQVDEALETLGQIADDRLDERWSAVARHARAVALLTAGRFDDAVATLDEVLGPTTDRALDLRIRMTRGMIALEQGRIEEALEIARAARDEAGDDADLKTEARLLRAAALDARGDRDEAMKALHTIGDEMMEVLLVVGVPRVRRLVEAAMDAREAE